jgi:hypothetical protein
LDQKVLVLPFMLALWFSPMLLFATSLRNRKRRMTIKGALVGLALLGIDFAFLFREPGPIAVFSLVVLYALPFLFAVLYLPRGWDVMTGLAWSTGTLMALLVAFSSVQNM